MPMYAPPHPGELLRELWLKPLGLTVTEAAHALNILRKALSELINGKVGLSAEMAVRLELAFGKSAASWLAHQAAHDLWTLEQSKAELGVRRLAA